MRTELIAKAVFARLQADDAVTVGMSDGVGGWQIVTGVFHRMGSPAAESDLAKPYIVFNIGITTGTNVMRGAMHDVELVFNIISPTGNTTSGTMVENVVQRLFGDRLSASGQTPTYGFDNHKLTLDTGATNAFGWDCNTVQFRSLLPTVLSEARWQTTITFAFQTFATATG